MKILLITPFLELESKTNRPWTVRRVLREQGYKVVTITSDFSHSKKERINYNTQDIFQLSTISYKSNVSVFRFISHFLLSIKFFLFYLQSNRDFDVIYITSPFALTSLFIGLVSPNKIIIDVVDFWPDSLPFKINVFTKPVLYLWRWVNLKSYKNASSVISLSSVFLKSVSRSNSNVYQIPICSNPDFCELDFFPSTLNILYVGNIGRLYDFDTLIKATLLSKRDIKIHIVGKGDVQELLIDRLKSLNVDFEFYGTVYDVLELKNIARQCQVGFNGFVEKTNASFSYKALTYFMFGLPVINSMKGDLFDAIEINNIGFNYSAGNVDSLKTVFDCELNLELKHNMVKRYFLENLDYKVVSKRIVDVFEG